MTISIENLNLDPTTKKNVDAWLNGHYDEHTKAEIRRMLKDDPTEIADAFYTSLSFGTGGMRGVMGIGSNRFNVYTVRAATQGLATYINKQPKPPQGHSVAISYDSRHNSRTFAEECAKVLAGNGIKVYLFRELRPTPLVSFAVRTLRCTSGIMITASHNPPEYNGYKVYWNDGAQVLPPHDTGIIAEVRAITDVSQVKVATFPHALIEEIGEKIDNAYLDVLDGMQFYPSDNKADGKELKIVYTPLSGTGITVVPKALARWGFSSFQVVKEQGTPNGDFPTTPSPNPEEKAALSLGIQLMEKTGSDILLATDPDADRMGIAVRHQGQSVLINGNEIACVLLDHVCRALKEQHRMPAKAAFIKTIVTTDLFRAIVESYGATCFDVLTGFKYIAEKIHEWEQQPNSYQYIFGGEESYGTLLGTHVRDKDAVIASCLMAEVASRAKKQGKTVVDLLNDLFKQYGVYREKLVSVKFEETKEGREQMRNAMVKLRQSPPQDILGVPIVAIEDYQQRTKRWIGSDKIEALALPKSDVLVFFLKDGGKVVIRPSGTEPKVKLYGFAVVKDAKTVQEGIAACDAKVSAHVDAFKALLK